MTYHDSCHLLRGLGESATPRVSVSSMSAVHGPKEVYAIFVDASIRG